MTNQQQDGTSPRTTRIKIAGFCLAAVGLVFGAFALDQCLVSLWNPTAGSDSLSWVAVEAVTCAALTSFGFVLLVLGSDQVEEFDDRLMDPTH